MLKHAIRTALGLAAFGLVLGPAQAADVEVKTKGGIQVTAGDFEIKFGGRIMLDGVNPSDDATPMFRNLFFRRARLELSGKVGEDWAYKAEYDFAENSLAAKDLELIYKGLGKGHEVHIGQFKQFFSLEELTSSKAITFMERSLPNAFSTGHRVGVGYKYASKQTTFGVSAYGNEAGTANTGNEPVSFGGRFTWAPILSEDSVLHFGVAMASESTGGANSVRLRARPEARPSNGGTRLVDTGNIAADGLTKTGLEAAWMNGPLSVQAEYMMTTVDALVGADPEFDGYYALVSYVPGGSRTYKGGAFGAPKVGKDGVWELRARLSSINLNDPAAGIAGGEEDNTGVGVTYYVNSNIRLLAEYLRIDAERGATQDDASILQFRAQVAW